MKLALVCACGALPPSIAAMSVRAGFIEPAELAIGLAVGALIAFAAAPRFARPMFSPARMLAVIGPPAIAGALRDPLAAVAIGAAVGGAAALHGKGALDDVDGGPTLRMLAPLALASVFFGPVFALDLAVLTMDAERLTGTAVHAERSRFQRILLMRGGDGVLRLYLDGQLQVSFDDERRYHEALVRPAMGAVRAKRVLLLGAGDGLAAREVLAHDVDEVVIVDIDARVTALAREHPEIARANDDALRDPRVRLMHEDALRFLRRGTDRFDVVIVDLPDPTSAAIAPLYARETWEAIARRLSPDGVLATQAGSPAFCPAAFACIASTIAAAGLTVRPYRADVPSFGGSGFVLAARTPIDVASLAPFALSEMDATDPTTLASPVVLAHYRAAIAAFG